MLRHAKTRLPTIRGDAYRLPFASGSCDAATGVMVHTEQLTEGGEPTPVTLSVRLRKQAS